MIAIRHPFMKPHSHRLNNLEQFLDANKQGKAESTTKIYISVKILKKITKGNSNKI